MPKNSVLIVDDEVDLLEAMREALSCEGYQTFVATDADTAIGILDRMPEIDLLVSDIRMPGMSGVDLVKMVKLKYSDRPWLQILFITAHASLDYSVAALRLGAIDFLDKPVKRNELLSSVSRAINKSSTLRNDVASIIQSQEQIDRLMRDMLSLSLSLKTNIDNISSSNSPTPIFSEATRSGSKESSLSLTPERMVELLRMKDIRTRFFNDKLFLDPAWFMLQDLMEHYLLKKKVSVTSIYTISGVAPTTAARRLDELESAGLVTRLADRDDKRRQFVELTDKAIGIMRHYLETLNRHLVE